jgi:hypothetical protein
MKGKGMSGEISRKNGKHVIGKWKNPVLVIKW